MRREPPVRIREGLGVKFPRATRLVICCRGTADEAMTAMRAMMSKLKLTVNETKTRLCRVPDETFDFLGYTFGRCYSPRTGRRLHRGASVGEEDPAALPRDQRADRPAVAVAGRRGAGRPAQPETGGWANYFRLGTVSRGLPRSWTTTSRFRLRQWLGEKHKCRGRVVTLSRTVPVPDLGLIRLAGVASHSFPWANA